MIALGLIVLSPLSQAEDTQPTILVLGDSISAAYGMSLEQGWVALLGHRLHEQGHKYEVINASISGETTGGGLRRLPALLSEHQPSLLVLELGANDGLRGFPLPNLQSNLERMVGLAQESGAVVLLLPMEVPPNYGARYTAGFRDSFIQVSEASGARLGPFPLIEVAITPELMQDDGLHPTAAAQPIILDTVYPSIQQMLEQQ